MPDTRPEITVLMAVFNGERYLPEAIESVLRQTMPDFELLIVDDNSSDDTATILQGYANRDNRIRVLRNDANLGPYPSANRGLRHAKADLIARLDADDNCAAGRLQRQLAFMTRHLGCLLVGGGYRSIDGEGGTRFVRHNAMDFATCAFVSRLRMPMVHPSFCFRKNLREGSPVLYEERFPIAGDFGLAASLALRGHIASLDGILVDYRMHENNISSTKLDRQRHYAHHIASEAIERHYPPEIARDLNALIDVHYKRAPASRPRLGQAVKGLEAALLHDFPDGPPGAVRERAAGILGESFLAGQAGAIPFFLADAPQHLVPLAKRFGRMRGWLPQRASEPA